MAHWRDHLNSSLLGAYSLYDDKNDGFKEIDGMILRTSHEEHNLGASGKQKCFVAYTSLDNKKPMKINVTIANAIALAAGSKNPDKWVNVPVTFFVDQKVKTKDGITEAIRCRKNNKAATVDYSAEEQMLKDCKTLEELASVYTQEGFPRTPLLGLKDQLKKKLTDELPKD